MTISYPDYDVSLEKIIRYYNAYIDKADSEAREQTNRAYGGMMRQSKGRLVEMVAKHLIAIAWSRMGKDKSQLWFDSQKIVIPIRQKALNNFPAAVAKHIRAHSDDFIYKCAVDIHVVLNGRFALGIECKSYTEIAMYKRILTDFSLLKTQNPDLRCYLVQLENMLGAGYDNTRTQNTGSYSGRTLDSYFPEVQLDVITLLAGRREVKAPIHEEQYRKPLTEDALNVGIEKLQEGLRAAA